MQMVVVNSFVNCFFVHPIPSSLPPSNKKNEAFPKVFNALAEIEPKALPC